MKRRSGGLSQPRAAKRMRIDDTVEADGTITKNLRDTFSHYMDPSFDVLTLRHRDQDKVRYVKQLGLGKLPNDAPSSLAPPNGLTPVSDREAEALGYPRDRCRINRERSAQYERQARTKTVLDDEVLERSLHVWLENDAVSRLETRTRAVREVNGEERRIRYLNKPLQDTLLDYIAAHPDAEVSLTSLRKIVKTKLKHITHAPPSNKESALCFAHDRATLLHQSLLRCGFFDERVFGDLSSLTQLSCCNIPAEETCLEGECDSCSGENGIVAFAERFCALVPDFDDIADNDMSYAVISNLIGGSGQYTMQSGTVLDFLGVSHFKSCLLVSVHIYIYISLTFYHIFF